MMEITVRLRDAEVNYKQDVDTLLSAATAKEGYSKACSQEQLMKTIREMAEVLKEMAAE